MTRRPVVLALLVVLGGACTTLGGESPDLGVEAELGRRAIDDYGCATCHTIPGVAGADALVGPPLTAFGRRTYIAGALPNTLDNLARWIEEPDEVEPGTAMPDLDVPPEVARQMAVYLHSLE